MERTKARRDYRLKTLQSALEYVGDRVRGLERFEGFLGRSDYGDDDDEAISKAMTAATENFRGLTAIGLIETDRRMKDAWIRFVRAKDKCEFHVGEADREVARPEGDLPGVREKYDVAVNEARDAAVEFRKAVENFVF